MSIDYSKGRYNVFKGRTAFTPIGRIDEDEYVRSPSNELLFRVDEDEFYGIDGKFIGRICPSDDGRAMVLDADHICLYVIAPE